MAVRRARVNVALLPPLSATLAFALFVGGFARCQVGCECLGFAPLVDGSAALAGNYGSNQKVQLDTTFRALLACLHGPSHSAGRGLWRVG